MLYYVLSFYDLVVLSWMRGLSYVECIDRVCKFMLMPAPENRCMLCADMVGLVASMRCHLPYMTDQTAYLIPFQVNVDDRVGKFALGEACGRDGSSPWMDLGWSACGCKQDLVGNEMVRPGNHKDPMTAIENPHIARISGLRRGEAEECAWGNLKG